jgi:hypothetical protein
MSDRRLKLAEEEELEVREAEEADEESESSADNEVSVVSLEDVFDIPIPAERAKKIRGFLIEVIGDDVDVREIETYTQEFWKLGFHSVEVILNHINEDWVEWMKPVHKLRLLERAKQHKRNV